MEKVVTEKYSYCRKYARYLSVVARLSGRACQGKIVTVKKYAILKRDILNFTQLLQEKESAKKCKEDLRNYKEEMSVLKEENTTLVDYVNNLEKLNVLPFLY